MSLDVLLAIEFFDHPKTLALQRAHGPAAVVALLRLWCWARRHRPSGDLDGMTDDDIERAAGWKGDRGDLVAAFLAPAPGEHHGFLQSGDFGPGCVYRIRNWSAKQPWARAYADAQSLAKTRRAAGRAGGLASAAKRAAEGTLTSAPRVGGRFASPKQTPKHTEATPQASTEANGQQHTEGRTDVTLCYVKAAPNPTEALRVPVSGEEEEQRVSRWDGGTRPKAPRFDGGPKPPDTKGARQAEEFAREAATLARITADVDAGRPISDRNARFLTDVRPELVRTRALLADRFPSRLRDLPPIPPVPTRQPVIAAPSEPTPRASAPVNGAAAHRDHHARDPRLTRGKTDAC
jgi:hypothetical protein